MSTTPLSSTVLGHFYTTNEKFNFIKTFGILIGFSGILYLFSDNLLIDENNFISALLILLGSTCYVIGGVLTLKISKKKNENVTGSILIWATIILIPLVSFIEQPWNLTPRLDSTISVIYLGLVSTGIAWLLRFRILVNNGLIFQSQVSYSNSNFWNNFKLYIFKRINYHKSINFFNSCFSWNLFCKKS